MKNTVRAYNLVLAAKPFQFLGPNKKTHERPDYCTIQSKRRGASLRRFGQRCSNADSTEGLLRSKKALLTCPKNRRGHVSPGV